MEVRLKTKDGKVTSLPGKKYEYDEIGFWEAFLKSLDLEGNLAGPEIKMMSFILANSPYRSYFKKPHVNKLLEHMGFKNYQNLWKYRQALEKLNLLEFTEEVRGDFLPGKNLRKFQIFLKDKLKNDQIDEIEIVIPIKIRRDGD